MKYILTLLLSINIFTTVFSQTFLTKEELSEKEIYYSIEEALENPEDVFVLELTYYEDKIDFDKLISLRKLHILKLSNQFLSNIPKELSQLTFLQHIDLANNELEEFPMVLFNLPNLKVVNLSGNKIKEVPKEISLLKNLASLDIVNNNLTSLPGSLSELSLTRLALSGNSFSAFPDVICKIPTLVQLYLNDIGMKEVPACMGNLTELKLLDLALNQLSSCPKEFEKLGKLMILNIAKNNFTQAEMDKIKKSFSHIRIIEF